MVTLPPEMLDAPELPLLLKEGAFRLENERLARNDFRDWLTPGKKAEFINGQIFVHSPSRYIHNDVRLNVSVLLRTFVREHELGVVLDEKALVALSRNDYEPDVIFYTAAKAAAFSANQMIFPAPDLVVEVLSESTKQHDRGIKFRDYAAHEIAEYWIIDPDTNSLERYLNRNGSYILEPLGPDLVVETPLLRGLRIPLRAIFDPAENQAFLWSLRSK